MVDWEDVRHFLAVAESGTLSGAARRLDVDHATVSRRLASLEGALGVRLVDRLPRAARLTATGQQVIERARAMEAGADAIARLAQAAAADVSRVTLSAPPVLVMHLLAQRLARFQARHPAILLSLAAQGQQVSLSHREADVALRLVRPTEAANVVRRIGTMAFGLYARRDYVHLATPAQWRFIAFDPSHADMPQQQWLLGIAAGRPIACELNYISEHLLAVLAGAGVAGLPCFIGDPHPDLVRLDAGIPPFAREIWLAVHHDLRASPAIRAVMAFVTDAIADNADLSAT